MSMMWKSCKLPCSLTPVVLECAFAVQVSRLWLLSCLLPALAAGRESLAAPRSQSRRWWWGAALGPGPAGATAPAQELTGAGVWTTGICSLEPALGSVIQVALGCIYPCLRASSENSLTFPPRFFFLSIIFP